jgi:hypothetical protein
MTKKQATAKSVPAKLAPEIAKSKPKVPKTIKATDAKSKKAAKVASKSVESTSKKLDLCLLLDCTGSMGAWIQRSKDTLCTIIDSVKKTHPDLAVRVSFVGYRDLEHKERFSILDFSEDLEKIKAFIAKVNHVSHLAAGAKKSFDFPEDLQGGMNQALKQQWSADSVKQAFLICDAPGHGKDIN